MARKKRRFLAPEAVETVAGLDREPAVGFDPKEFRKRFLPRGAPDVRTTGERAKRAIARGTHLLDEPKPSRFRGRPRLTSEALGEAKTGGVPLSVAAFGGQTDVEAKRARPFHIDKTTETLTPEAVKIGAEAGLGIPEDLKPPELRTPEAGVIPITPAAIVPKPVPATSDPRRFIGASTTEGLDRLFPGRHERAAMIGRRTTGQTPEQQERALRRRLANTRDTGQRRAIESELSEIERGRRAAEQQQIIETVTEGKLAQAIAGNAAAAREMRTALAKADIAAKAQIVSRVGASIQADEALEPKVKDAKFKSLLKEFGISGAADADGNGEVNTADAKAITEAQAVMAEFGRLTAANKEIAKNRPEYIRAQAILKRLQQKETENAQQIIG